MVTKGQSIAILQRSSENESLVARIISKLFQLYQIVPGALTEVEKLKEESPMAYCYLRENLGAPFIIASIVLLLFCAYQLSNGYEIAGNASASYAFYSLVVGAALQVVSRIKN
jgi:hypothetical protein